MADDDYYSNSSGSDDAAGPSESGEGMDGADKSGMGEETHETTLVPKSMFEGKDLKPGDEFYFTIVALHESEVEVEYKHEDKGDESESPEKAFDSKFAMMGGGGGGSY